jgi:iron complex transport system ATP-binding protein
MKLEARDITVTIKGCKIVDGASLSLASGELVGLIGPNGAGKSTLLKAIIGIRERAAGSVTIDGKDFDAMPSLQRARNVAFLPQERRVEWRLPVHDIVMLGRYPHQSGFGGPTDADKAAVARALEAVDCTGIEDRPVAVLSGGERTRVLLARALAVEAPLLMVDEPIAALDPYHQLHVMEILRERAKAGTGVLAVIHDLSLAMRFMDRLVLLDEGAVAADGAPDAVLTPEMLAAVYRVDAVSGEDGGRKFVLPWSRKSDVTRKEPRT